MNSGEILETETETENESTKKGFHYVLLRLVALPIGALLLFSLLIGLLALLFAEFSVSSSIVLPSHCKIVSSSVDIRSSKVEYIDHSIGETKLALAEAPNEALPLDCRPNFGAALLTQHKFKVNETYDCWYTSGVSKVSLYRDSFFSCHVNDPSTIEMIRRYVFLSTKILQSWFSSKTRAMYWSWETIAGLVTGFFTSFITISIVKIFQQMKSWMLAQNRYTICCKRACFLVVYLSVMCWLAIQYLKRLGLRIFQSL